MDSKQDIWQSPLKKSFAFATTALAAMMAPSDERLDLIRRLSNFLNPGGKILLSTACQGFRSTQLLNLWGEMTAGAGALPQPDSVCDLMSQASFISPRKIELLPGGGFFAFVGTKGIL